MKLSIKKIFKYVFVVLFVIITFIITDLKSHAEDFKTHVQVINPPPMFVETPITTVINNIDNPANIDEDITFTAMAADIGGVEYYLIICSTNSITPVMGAAPKCDEVTWCVSNLTKSGEQATCTIDILDEFLEINGWYAFVCSAHPTEPVCSASTSGPPFYVNHAPTFGTVTNDSPKDRGEIVTWRTDQTKDNDFLGGADLVKLIVCKKDGLFNGECVGGTDGTWCSSDLVSANPTCTYKISDDLNDGLYDAYVYVVDNHNLAAINQNNRSDLIVNYMTMANQFYSFIKQLGSLVRSLLPNLNNNGILIQASPFLLSTAAITLLFGTSILPPIVSSTSGFGVRTGVLMGVIIPKKRKYWGIVYDRDQAIPIPFGIVRLYRKSINDRNIEQLELLEQTVTDLEGRYGQLIDQSGEYILEAIADGYEKFRKTILYNQGDEVIDDVPLQKVDKGISGVRKFIYYSKTIQFKYLRAFLIVLMIIGFIYSFIVVVSNFQLEQFLILILYAITLLINLIWSFNSIKKKIGKVKDKNTHAPISGAIVGVYDSERQINVILTNKQGEMKINLPSREYNLNVQKVGYVMEVKGLQKVFINREGYLDEDILLQKI